MTVASSLKVAVLGASGGIGQPLSLLLKLNPRIRNLALYDIAKAGVPAKGVAADVGDMNTYPEVHGFAGDDELPKALEGAHVVVISAGVPRKPGMTRDDLFKINAGIAMGLADNIKKYAPKTAIIPVITNPVNSVVPIVNEVIQSSHRVLGITTLDVVRACTILGRKIGKDPAQVQVPVVGGHAGETIVPLFSQATPLGCAKGISAEELIAMDKMVQDAGTVVVNAKGGAGSATLSMAFAASKFVDAVLRAVAGDKGVTECCYAFSEGEYFAAPFRLGVEGIEERLDLGSITEYEKKRLSEARAKLVSDVKVGVDFAKSNRK